MVLIQLQKIWLSHVLSKHFHTKALANTQTSPQVPPWHVAPSQMPSAPQLPRLGALLPLLLGWAHCHLKGLKAEKGSLAGAGAGAAAVAAGRSALPCMALGLPIPTPLPVGLAIPPCMVEGGEARRLRAAFTRRGELGSSMLSKRQAPAHKSTDPAPYLCKGAQRRHRLGSEHALRQRRRRAKAGSGGEADGGGGKWAVGWLGLGGRSRPRAQHGGRQRGRRRLAVGCSHSTRDLLSAALAALARRALVQSCQQPLHVRAPSPLTQVRKASSSGHTPPGRTANGSSNTGAGASVAAGLAEELPPKSANPRGRELAGAGAAGGAAAGGWVAASSAPQPKSCGTGRSGLVVVPTPRLTPPSPSHCRAGASRAAHPLPCPPHQLGGSSGLGAGGGGLGAGRGR